MDFSCNTCDPAPHPARHRPARRSLLDHAMHLSDFDYALPEHLIAQEPAARRDCSRLLVLTRSREGTPAGLSHHVFTDLPGLLSPGDLLILNDTRVVAARLLGRRA